MVSVTVDTNVIVSGLYGSGKPRSILAAAEAGAIRLKISRAILDEVAEVLQRDKFGWTAAEAQYATEWLSDIADVVEPKQTVDIIKTDVDENRILECALAAKSDYIVSGDKHLLNLRTFERMPIVKAADFLEVTQGSGR